MASQSSIRLFCFPYAGASASVYARWKRRMPAWIDVVPVEYPGRGRRMRESHEVTVPGMLASIAGALNVLPSLPFALFGHSLGAILAFELAYGLRQRGVAEPRLLFVSGSRPPAYRVPERYAAFRTDEELRAELVRLDGTPACVLDNEELMQLTLPVLRADFRVAASYRAGAGQRLGCPIHALGGTEDEAPQEVLLAWREHTESDFRFNMLPGGHFFIHQHEAALLQLIEAELRDVLRAHGKEQVRSAPAASRLESSVASLAPGTAPAGPDL